MVILVGGEKGGTGKTTIAVNLAAFRAGEGQDVLLVDTDSQGSASFWVQIRSEVNGVPWIPCVQKNGKSLPKDVLDLATRYEDIIIDAGGRDYLELRYSLGVAHRVYIPIQPTQFDLNTLSQMDNLVEQAQALNPNLQAFVIINRASSHPRTSDTTEAQEIVNEYSNIKLIKTVIRERVAYQRSVREGLSVAEVISPDTKAVTEIQELCEEIYHHD